MDVFGFMMLSRSTRTEGTQLIHCNPTVPLEYAGWSKPYKGFIPELSWSTEKPFWSLAPVRNALISRCEDLCEMDAVELLNAGRRLGAVDRDSRLRQAMTVLGLTPNQLAVPVHSVDDDLYRMRWAEVLDHLIGFKHFKTTQTLHQRICQLDNTAASSVVERWLNKQTWACSLEHNILGDHKGDWVIDLCQAKDEGWVRMISQSSAAGHYLVTIHSSQWIDLQDISPSNIEVHSLPSHEELLATIKDRGLQRNSMATSLSWHNDLKDKLPSGIRSLYQGQPVASSLVGLKQPRIRIKMGDLVAWSHSVPFLHSRPADQEYASSIIQEGPLIEQFPASAFSMTRSFAPGRNDIEPADALRQFLGARVHTLPGGLFRKDLPAVPSRVYDEKQSGVELYKPVNPFAGV